jgi:hypothetical protein
MQSMGKAIIAALYAAAVIAVPLFEGNHVPSPAEWVQIVIALLTAVTVYVVPLVKGAAWVKTAVGALLAVAQVLVTVINDGINGNDGLMIVFALAGALGIYLAPADSTAVRSGTRVGWGTDREQYELAA